MVGDRNGHRRRLRSKPGCHPAAVPDGSTRREEARTVPFQPVADVARSPDLIASSVSRRTRAAVATRAAAATSVQRPRAVRGARSARRRLVERLVLREMPRRAHASWAPIALAAMRRRPVRVVATGAPRRRSLLVREETSEAGERGEKRRRKAHDRRPAARQSDRSPRSCPTDDHLPAREFVSLWSPGLRARRRLAIDDLLGTASAERNLDLAISSGCCSVVEAVGIRRVRRSRRARTRDGMIEIFGPVIRPVGSDPDES